MSLSQGVSVVKVACFTPARQNPLLSRRKLVENFAVSWEATKTFDWLSLPTDSNAMCFHRFYLHCYLHSADMSSLHWRGPMDRRIVRPASDGVGARIACGAYRRLRRVAATSAASAGTSVARLPADTCLMK